MFVKLPNFPDDLSLPGSVRTLGYPASHRVGLTVLVHRLPGSTVHPARGLRLHRAREGEDRFRGVTERGDGSRKPHLLRNFHAVILL